MIYRLMLITAALVLSAGIASATDLDRHGTFTEAGAAAGAAAKCKNFIGTDDNRSHCTDWCSSYTAANAGTSCTCDEGACAEPEAPAAAPAAAH